MELVLVHPEIPHNTGCAARLAAALDLSLHLVEPLGFSLEDRYLKRAGLDYWPMVDLHVHPDWPSLVAHLERGGGRPLGERLRLFTSNGGSSLFEVPFAADEVLVFGAESAGLPAALLDEHPSRRVYVPIRREVRSLNLANVVCLGAYTAMHVAGMPLPDNDGSHVRHPRADEGIQPTAVARRHGPEAGA
jgi:tRNA (cytidine/uridine-2'-O-)-methyltransferase